MRGCETCIESSELLLCNVVRNAIESGDLTQPSSVVVDMLRVTDAADPCEESRDDSKTVLYAMCAVIRYESSVCRGFSVKVNADLAIWFVQQQAVEEGEAG